jgi:SAM-dependent methyltransferase
MTLNPATQYADDRNLRARQRLWLHQDPPFDLVGWVLDLAGLSPGLQVLDVGCGNGAYLRAMRDRHVRAVGCDLSIGMLRAASHPALVNADVVALPVRDASFGVVLAPHMLYHVPDRESAARELRRALIPGGVCVAVTNGSQHLRSLRDLVEQAARTSTPGWEMRGPSAQAFSLENGAAQLGGSFEHVTCMRPSGVAPVVIRDATVAADYVASLASHYQDEVACPWQDVVQDVRCAVQQVIGEKGAFITAGDTGAFVCR